jgi:hypothetical protein
MSAKPGRNDPCPCGSGRKFKHCCGSVAATVEPQEALVWRRMRRLLQEHNPEAQDFLFNVYGAEAIDAAWDEFRAPLGGEPRFDPEPPELREKLFPLFLSWLLAFWSPEKRDRFVRDPALRDVEPMRAYLERRGKRLDPLLREYLASCLAEPLSFHRVREVDPGKGFVLTDLVTGIERPVAEGRASQTTQLGDILFAHVVQAGGIWLLECCSPVAFPPIDEIRIVEMCRDFVGRRKQATFPLRDFNREMLEMHHAVAAPHLDPRPPTLHNLDGEPLSLRKVVFDIDSPERALEALRSLDPADDAELAGDLRRDENGALVGARLHWLEPSKKGRRAARDKVVAMLTIGASRLTAEVNSEARERRLRELVDELLGPEARYRATEIQSVERMMGEAVSGEGSAAAHEPADDGAASPPEVQAFMQDYLRRHYEEWVNERIPALGNRTPMQAVKTKAGREAVEALVRQLERDAGKMRPPMEPEILKRLRSRLGLPEGD